MKAPEERSPLKDKPLRLPGQALQEQREALIADKLEPWLLLALFMAVLAGWEWWRYWKLTPPTPWLFTAVAVAVALVAVWRFQQLRPRLRALRLGMEGERAVGQFLERLREQGYQVFHDLQGEGFNVDHVCIGPAGVFTIETKTWSKPRHGEARIRYDGEKLSLNGHEPERDVDAPEQEGRDRHIEQQRMDGRRHDVDHTGGGRQRDDGARALAWAGSDRQAVPPRRRGRRGRRNHLGVRDARRRFREVRSAPSSAPARQSLPRPHSHARWPCAARRYGVRPASTPAWRPR